MPTSGRRLHIPALAPKAPQAAPVSITGTIAEAPVLAQRAVEWAQRNGRLRLDYAADSLPALDDLVEGIRASGTTESDASALLYSLGCYLGEVFVRNDGARWDTTANVGMTAVCSFPIALRLSDGRGLNPIGKVFKRFRNGKEDSVAFFYRAVRSVAPR